VRHGQVYFFEPHPSAKAVNDVASRRQAARLVGLYAAMVLSFAANSVITSQ